MTKKYSCYPPFSHGHLPGICLNVKGSRRRSGFFFSCNHDQIEEGAIIADNVVYPEMMMFTKVFIIKDYINTF